MARGTQIVIRSRERTEYGFPMKLGIYFVGEARRINGSRACSVLVDVLRENGLGLPRPPIHLQTESADQARELAIQHYRDLACYRGLEISIREISGSGETVAARPAPGLAAEPAQPGRPG